MIFKNRIHAGKELARALEQYKGREDVVVVALPRGGVVLGYEIARKLNLVLDIVVPRKVGAPGNPEYAIGAITEEGDFIKNPEAGDAPKDYLEKEIANEKQESKRRLETYRQGLPQRDLADKTVLLVDDGIATGQTMEAAVKTLRNNKVKEIIVAVPVSAQDSLKRMQSLADKVVCLDAPLFFAAVGSFYEEFSQTEDIEVIELLKKARNIK